MSKDRASALADAIEQIRRGEQLTTSDPVLSMGQRLKALGPEPVSLPTELENRLWRRLAQPARPSLLRQAPALAFAIGAAALPTATALAAGLVAVWVIASRPDSNETPAMPRPVTALPAVVAYTTPTPTTDTPPLAATPAGPLRGIDGSPPTGAPAPVQFPMATGESAGAAVDTPHAGAPTPEQSPVVAGESNDVLPTTLPSAELVSLEAEAGAQTIIVTLILAAPVEPMAVKYQIHFDIQADGFFTPANPDEPHPACPTTSNFTSQLAGNRNGVRETGPGDFTYEVGSTELVLTVSYPELEVNAGELLYLWAVTQYRGIADREPDTDPSDGCSKPQNEDEVLILDLGAGPTDTPTLPPPTDTPTLPPPTDTPTLPPPTDTPEPTPTSTPTPAGPASATIDFDPDTLNLKSKGNRVTVYIELPSGYDVADIDATTVRLNGTVPAITDPKYGFVTDPDSYLVDHDRDGILERMVKFNRADVEEIVEPDDQVVITVTGQVDGSEFSGSDIIRVIDPPKPK